VFYAMASHATKHGLPQLTTINMNRKGCARKAAAEAYHKRRAEALAIKETPNA
jgi:hypothetical protein